jgi:two-component system sensor kinase FixL
MRRVFAGEAVVYEFKRDHPEGPRGWMETHAVPLRDARGNIYALLGITRDITEHKQAEEQARRHQTELARVARLSTMGEMATGIAHELNQPLSAIANFSRGCIRRLRSGGMSAGRTDRAARGSLRTGRARRRHPAPRARLRAQERAAD